MTSNDEWAQDTAAHVAKVVINDKLNFAGWGNLDSTQRAGAVAPILAALNEAIERGKAEAVAERDELRRAIYGTDHTVKLSNGQYAEMARETEAARLGALARAHRAEAKLARLENPDDALVEILNSVIAAGEGDRWARAALRAIADHLEPDEETE